MLLIDIPKPTTCRECPMSCQIPIFSGEVEIRCRTDFKKHEPLDETCPIKGEQ